MVRSRRHSGVTGIGVRGGPVPYDGEVRSTAGWDLRRCVSFSRTGGDVAPIMTPGLVRRPTRSGGRDKTEGVPRTGETGRPRRPRGRAGLTRSLNERTEIVRGMTARNEPGSCARNGGRGPGVPGRGVPGCAAKVGPRPLPDRLAARAAPPATASSGTRAPAADHHSGHMSHEPNGNL